MGLFGGGSPPRAPVAHPLGVENLIISLVLCVFAAQGWLACEFFKNELILRILILTKVRRRIVRSVVVVFQEPALRANLRIHTLTWVRRMIVRDHHFS